MEDAAIFGILLLVERWLRTVAPTPFAPVDGERVPSRLLPPAGIVLGIGMVLWGIERFLDEHLWLGEDGGIGSVLTQLAGIGLAIAGIVLLATRYRAFRAWRTEGADGDGSGGEATVDDAAGADEDEDAGDGTGETTDNVALRDVPVAVPEAEAPAGVDGTP
jgi:hypothetical protein